MGRWGRFLLRVISGHDIRIVGWAVAKGIGKRGLSVRSTAHQTGTKQASMES
ncbi:hypothetical protein BJP36_41055 [Moorena producens JHB]|uniref:Uncharacterized protein n=1 Tax=Moorena producens (strain JHB) TaxID=1454205 RepID=A0A9Q9SSE1_MOOP1|nr:hypothetical protein [Moorena producens]WAN68756.1 hypothetical protein BJP36_41055 [Moorena producens JHB]